MRETITINMNPVKDGDLLAWIRAKPNMQLVIKRAMRNLMMEELYQTNAIHMLNEKRGD